MEPLQKKAAARTGSARTGRPYATSRPVLERLGFELFARQGFDGTTVDDIADAAGIGRRTFFRYFASKNDLVWGDFEAQLARLDALLAAADPDTPMMDAVREAVVEFNRFDPALVPWHRQRMALILRVPTLQADSAVRYASWRTLVTEFAARRLDRPASDLLPRLIGGTVLAACVAAYEQWLTDEDADLSDLLDLAVRQLAAGYGDLGSG
ncbi:TetR family transcriptional regulator [Streptomyces graminofaciens]|uniref:TetR family transcriptional regulator n=1 Tax=Streptomyces graminofaciens TaxID=68212 RepID=A0ABN5VYL8_9ACTN|nr:mycofactocin system transcriptional regulator [Streptomyces graminofaciens]BBC38362.1 TetR family transcriptional regulator [Streptomyces graminofaciens]